MLYAPHRMCLSEKFIFRFFASPGELDSEQACNVTHVDT